MIHPDFDTNNGPAAEYKAEDERQQRENEPINAQPLAAPVYILEMHYEWEGSTLIGVYASVDEAKADANRGVYGDSQTISECVGGRQMKQVARREQTRTSAGEKLQFGLWL